MSASKQKRWRTVWITGASTGIGAAMVKKFAGQCENLIISARGAEQLAEVAAPYDNATSMPLDVSDFPAVADTVRAIESKFGAVDLAVLNAAMWEPMRVQDMDFEKVRKSMDVNYFGVLAAIHALLPSMREQRNGQIAIMASTAGYRGLPQSIAYGPTKAALINMAENLRCEAEGQGINVSVICPGFVDTPATQKNDFDMPGLISADQAAQSIFDGLAAKKYWIAFPFRFSLSMNFLRIMPHALFFWLVRKFIWKDEHQQNSAS